MGSLSFGIEMYPQVIGWDVFARLAEDGTQRARVQLAMRRNRQRLLLTMDTKPTKFHVASTLTVHDKTKLRQDAYDLRPRQSA
jgi:hypothetical protein